MPKSRLKIIKAAAGLLLLLLAGKLEAQGFGAMDSLAGTVAGRDLQMPATTVQYDPDLDLWLEQELAQGIVFDLRYRTFDGQWQRRREESLESLTRASRYDFLSKPAEARTGEGLIPDISVPLPGLDKVLGAGAQVKINGNQKISVGGEQTVYPNSKSTSELERARSNFDLKIKQEQRINLEGVIGDRVHVLIDHDSQADIDKKSKVRLRYEGKEDEIIESLEAGDTEFSIQGSSLVGGLTTVHKGLFGIKGVARLGGLELSAIASKDEGQSQSESYTGQSQKDSFALRDYEFINYRFYRLPLAQGDSIMDLRVYVNDNTQTSQAINAWLLDHSWRDFGYDPSRVDTLYGSLTQIMLKENLTDYVLDDRRNGILYTRHSLDRSHIMAVAMKVYNPGYGVRYYPDSTAFYPGVFINPNLAVMKRSNPQPPDSINGYSWLYQERRFYDLRKPQIIQSSLKIRIYKDTGENVLLERDTLMPGRPTFIHRLGLDRDDNGEIDPDFLRLGDEGFFYFPYSEPFAMDSLLTDPNTVIYRKVDPEPSDSKYRVVITFLTSTAIFNLRAPGRIIEGSVKVYVGGQLLPESDYQMDYDTGLITFTAAASDRINRPDVQLKIDYQYYPIFALGSKTLAGVRGLYKFNESSQLGATWMYRSERTPEDKPRLGEEPRRIIVAGVDGSFTAKPELMTRLADALPGVETEAPSRMSFSGEAAANFPNPNTKGQVYIDDMDGAKLSDEFTLSRLNWARSSVPTGKQASQLARTFYWYNPRNRVTMGELNPNLTDPAERSQQLTTLKMHLVPDTAAGPADSSWAGITTVLSKTGLDLTERRLLNVWVRSIRSDQPTAGQGKLHIDIGKSIHEDQARRNAAGLLVGPNDSVNGEPLSAAGEQVTTDANDIGIDGFANGSPYDDGSDDFNRDDSTRMNGTEGNGYYDTEDLLLTGKPLGTPYGTPQNNYHTFSFDLSGGSGWQKLTIALDSARQVGNIARNEWNNLVYARVWMDGLSAPGDIELAMVEVTGNRWLSQGVATEDTANPVDPQSERFDISVKNNRDDADYSQNPPYTPDKDEQGRVKFEQSLVYKIASLDSGHTVSARRSLREGENNYTGYRTMRLYVRNHGRAVRGSFFVRLIASDSNSYYEYREPLTGYWRDVGIELDRFSDLKKLPRDSGQIFVRQGNYSMRGRPNLTQLSRIALGAYVDENVATGDNVEVWFDDLRLDDVRRDGGAAMITRLDLGFADLLDVNLSYNDRSSHFYRIDERPPTSGSRSQAFGASGTIRLHKFFLEKLGLTLPLTYRYAASNTYPEFGRDDIRLNKEESREEATRRRELGFGAGISKSLSKYWLTNLTVDRLSPSVSWSRNTGRDPNSADSNTTLTMALGYRWSPATRRELKVFRGWKLSYLPSNLSWDWNSSQTRIWRWDKLANVVSTVGSGRTRTAQGQFGWQPVEQLTYSFGTQRNLLQKRMAGHLAQRLGLGSEVGRNQSIDYRTNVKWLKVVQPTVSYTVRYNESHQMYGGQAGADSVDVMATTNSNSFSSSAGLGLGKWMSFLTGLRNEKHDTSAEAGSPRWAVIQLEKFFKRWNGVSLEFSQTKSSQTSGLLSRPGFLYQIGWQRDPSGIARYRQAGSDQSSLGNNYSATTQASMGRISLDLAWRLGDEWRWSGGVTSSRRSLTWPDVRATMGSLERLGFWRKAMSSSSLTANYSLTADSSWQQDRGFLSKGQRQRIGAAWNGRWKNQINSDLSADYSLEETREPNQNYPDGIFHKVTSSRKLSTSLSYAFSAPKGLVLNFGKLGKRRFRFTSSLSMSLRAEYTEREEKSNSVASRDLVPSRRSQELSVAPSASYNFSRSITGNLAMEYAFNKDRISSVNNWRRYSLNAAVDIKF
jgi:hypothetical protein